MHHRIGRLSEDDIMYEFVRVAVPFIGSICCLLVSTRIGIRMPVTTCSVVLVLNLVVFVRTVVGLAHSCQKEGSPESHRARYYLVFWSCHPRQQRYSSAARDTTEALVNSNIHVFKRGFFLITPSLRSGSFTSS